MKEELAIKLKNALLNHLKRDKGDLDRKYLVSPNSGPKSSWTLREVIEEIEQETPFGIEMLMGIMNLSIDFLSRGKAKL